MEKSRKPKIRFKGFTDDWEQREFSEIFDCTISNNTLSRSELSYEEGSILNIHYGDILIKYGSILDIHKYKIPRIPNEKKEDFRGSLLQPGDIVIADTAEDETTGKACEIGSLFGNSIVAGLHTMVARPNIEMASGYLGYYLNSNAYHCQLLPMMQGIKVLSLSRANVKKTALKFPESIKEQQLIANYFIQLDELITLHQRKLDKFVNVKKSMLEKMFPKQGSKVPNIRFAGFADDWEQRKLDSLCKLITKQTGFDYSETIKPALVTDKELNTYSFIQNKDFEGENINLDTDFYIPIEVAERFPKIILDMPSLLISISGKIGNVGYYGLKTKAFIGGAVGICKLKEDIGSMLVYALQSEAGQTYFRSLIKASSHANITVEDIRNIIIKLPHNERESQKVAEYFCDLDHLITLHQRKLEKLKNIKKSMLEKMFI